MGSKYQWNCIYVVIVVQICLIFVCSSQNVQVQAAIRRMQGSSRKSFKSCLQEKLKLGLPLFGQDVQRLSDIGYFSRGGYVKFLHLGL